MFTGFASENTPAIQVWNFFGNVATSNAVQTVSLVDDCSPVQLFRTGSSITPINVYLPTAPIEGKTIRIINTGYASSRQAIRLLSSENSGDGANSLTPVYQIGQGQVLDLTYSKDAISYGSSNGIRRSGWVSTNMAPASAGNFYSTVASGRNNHASASLCGVFSGENNVASAQYSFVSSGANNTASNNYAVIVGGASNTANGTFAALVGGNNNISSGESAFVGSGSSNTASGTSAAVVGGQSSTASGINALIVGGQSNSATTSQAAVFGGISNVANAVNSVVVGGGYSTTRSIVANFVSPASNAPISSGSGVQQTALLVLGRQTTDATPTVLASNSSAVGTTNQVILPNNSAYTFQGTCIANVTAGGTTSGWKFEGVIKRGANAASTALVAAVTPTVIAQDVGAVTWVLAITADTTNGGIKVEVTGAAATTIRWVAKIETTEVTF